MPWRGVKLDLRGHGKNLHSLGESLWHRDANLRYLRTKMFRAGCTVALAGSQQARLRSVLENAVAVCFQRFDGPVSSLWPRDQYLGRRIAQCL